MPTLYVISHCESCYNRDHIFCGRTNSFLTQNGIAHAKETAEQLKNCQIDIAYHTSLFRTKQTLKPILKYHTQCEVRIDDRLIERDYGDLSGINREEYQKNHPDLFPIYHRSYDVPPPGGESIQQVEVRVLDFLDDLLPEMKSSKKNVLLVIHGNSIRPVLRYFEHLSVEEMMKLEHTRHKIYEYEI